MQMSAGSRNIVQPFPPRQVAGNLPPKSVVQGGRQWHNENNVATVWPHRELQLSLSVLD